MTKTKTHYEQIPVERVKALTQDSASKRAMVNVNDKPLAPVSSERKENEND